MCGHGGSRPPSVMSAPRLRKRRRTTPVPSAPPSSATSSPRTTRSSFSGANLGAAAYEYGIAHVIRALLYRGEAPAYASFESDWVPSEYLADYYSVVELDERQTIDFFVEAIAESEPNEPVLFFGVGPALHHVFLAANKASEIHLGDYLQENLCEIERWIEHHIRAHDWRPFVRYTLECEGLVAPSEAEIIQREEATRGKITRLLKVDLRRPDPLGDMDTPLYGTVISAYCADSATDDRGRWETYMKRIVGLVRPGGTLITAALRRSRLCRRRQDVPQREHR